MILIFNYISVDKRLQTLIYVCKCLLYDSPENTNIPLSRRSFTKLNLNKQIFKTLKSLQLCQTYATLFN
jgi:hypothetical protein